MMALGQLQNRVQICIYRIIYSKKYMDAKIWFSHIYDGDLVFLF